MTYFDLLRKMLFRYLLRRVDQEQRINFECVSKAVYYMNKILSFMWMPYMQVTRDERKGPITCFTQQQQNPNFFVTA